MYRVKLTDAGDLAYKWYTTVVQVRVFTTLSRHPGIKKRDYPAQIMRKRKPTFSPRMHAAIDKALGKR